MSGLGELDRPGRPSSPGGWDVRSKEWAGDETDMPESAVPESVVVESGEPRSAPAGERPQTAGRRTTVDPVKALMHRHRELCERAVDPLEIAAGLEAHGVTDRTAGRFRHRDVFSLAEEMYARVPRDGDAPARTTTPDAPRARADGAVLALLPGVLCAATVTGLRLTEGQPRLIVAVVGAPAVALALRASLSRGPLRLADRVQRPTAAWTCWLIAYAALGDALLSAALTGGPDAPPTGSPGGAWPSAAAGVLALSLSCAPAVWCAHLFAARARRRLAASRGLEEYATAVRPLLLGTFALYLAALTALLALSGIALDEPAAYPQILTLGALLLLARLLAAHGFTHAPALVLTVATAAEALALASAFAARLPGCAFLATPVEFLVTTWGPGAVPTLVCGAGALTLLIHSSRTLTRASAHATPDVPC
ncbi:hypothetical protein STRCI_005359 [Streptomyces cinnabarinus]|uniref:Integral membrane protein n=1 Tax=Streptomyces cinnabarinus TaxID=67287 RepID=A0ABY7KJW8_9ACTN|nr:hypothetical protein [Streptomyces cinnabarinus]WAZ23980.1 hypothetical protein STRCI_005359 [Streptomyces cinnabarinus]